MTPAARLLLASAGLLYVLKAAALATRRAPPTVTGRLAFLFAWPGVVPDCFRDRGTPQVVDPVRFLAAWSRMVLGAVWVVALAICAPYLSDSLVGLAGLAALLLAFHFGLADLLPWLLRWAGFRVPLLFDRPWAARSLTDFWSRRWNLAFVEMNRRLFLRPLGRRFGPRGAGFALFVLSGVLHEAALSFPARGGWGLPLGYFLLQYILIRVEARFHIANRAWTWFWLLAPAPWLFHEAFRRTLIVPFYRWLHALIALHSLDWYVSYALYAAVAAHLAVLAGGLQAPARLGWKQDLPKLSRFNQKIFWLYGFYIVLCIVSFAGLTWRLHDSFLAGDTAARYLAGFIAVFWTIRVLADVVWYDHRDWPPGNALVAGHATLTTLFAALATVYWLAVLLPRP